MPSRLAATAPLRLLMADDTSPERDLSAFHAGDRRLLAALYEEHFRTVEHAVASLLTGADRETVVHDVFFRLLSDADFRRTFQGGSLGAWLRTVARNRAIDFRRRYYDRERALAGEGDAARSAPDPPDAEARIDTQRFMARLRAAVPPRWLPVFEQRFLAGLSQREAAQALGIRRTTLAYQEAQIRRILHKTLQRGLAK